MRVHFHSVCWNDRRMLDYFFRHYDWVDHFYLFDDGSDDGTLEYLLARSDVTVARTPRSDPDSWVASARHIYNSDWKRSIGIADWVVITNIDEHLHHPSLPDYLREMTAAGVTAIPALGYQMITDRFPEPDIVLAERHRMGAPWKQMSKLGLFRPDKIEEINFTPGRHEAAPTGEVVYPSRDELQNLHYKYLGLEETNSRHGAQLQRLGPTDRENGWGHRYHWDQAKLASDFEAFRARLTDISAGDPHTDHAEPRWWRPA